MDLKRFYYNLEPQSLTQTTMPTGSKLTSGDLNSNSTLLDFLSRSLTKVETGYRSLARSILAGIDKQIGFRRMYIFFL